MKRDCGLGELIPVRWEVVSCIGKTDRETVKKFTTEQMARELFEAVADTLPAFSNVRLYATDRFGYSNVLARVFADEKGVRTDWARPKDG